MPALTACNQVENRNLWGDVIYTCDSDLAVALLHQGYYSQNHMHPPNQVGNGMGRGWAGAGVGGLCLGVLQCCCYSLSHMHLPNQVGKGMGRGRGQVWVCLAFL